MNKAWKITGFGLVACFALACSDDESGNSTEASDSTSVDASGDDSNDSNDSSETTGDTSDESQNQNTSESAPTTDDGSAATSDRDASIDDQSSNDDDSTGPNSTAPNSSNDQSTEPAGDGPMIGNCPLFPADNAWNTDISDAPLHPNSDAFIDSIGRTTKLHPDFGTEWEGAPIGIPYVIVDAAQPKVEIEYTAYGDESDPGPMPIPEDAPIEGGPDGDGDRHTLVIDEDNCTLYELYRAFPAGDGFEAESGTVWDLRRNEDHPEGCTSADAAGLPIFPGLARYDEVVVQGEVLHALRFTVARSQRGYVYPARHYASNNTDPNLAPMGLRVRMKGSYDCSGYSTEVQVLCTAMKRFGMIVADNGSNWYVSGAPDPRWSDDNLRDLKDISGDAFEVVDTGPIVTDSPDCNL